MENKVPFINFLNYFDASLEHHQQWAALVDRILEEKAPEVLDKTAYPYAIWKSPVPKPERLIEPQNNFVNFKIKNADEVVLLVPYFTQRDNPRLPAATCNVTSIAMVLAYYGEQPQSSERQLEDEMLDVLIWLYGPNSQTNHHALEAATKHYNYAAEFRKDRTWEQVKNELDEGRPVVIAGMFTSSGHIVTIIGYNREGFIVHDPWGNALSKYTDHNGEAIIYPYDYMHKVCWGRKEVWGVDGLWCHFIHPKEAVTSSSNFEKALEILLEFEGGLSKNPTDLAARQVPAGHYHTNMGITFNTYQKYRKARNLPAQGVDKMTAEEVKEIYKQMFWEKVHGDEFDFPLALVLFDGVVQFNMSAFIGEVQRLAYVRPTGHMNRDTIDELKSKDQVQFAKILMAERKKYREEMVKKNPSQIDFWGTEEKPGGWRRRDNKIVQIISAV